MVCVLSPMDIVPYESDVTSKAIVSWNMAWTVFEDGYSTWPWAATARRSNDILEELEIKNNVIPAQT